MIQTLQQKIVVINITRTLKKCFPTLSEGDLFDKFELESVGQQEKATESILGMKVAHSDQRNLRKQREKSLKILLCGYK